MKSTVRFVLPLVLLTLVALPASAEGKTYRSSYVITPTGWCMIKDGGGVGCSSPSIPAMTDGYAWMKRRGKVQLGDTGNPITKRPLKPPFPRLRKGDRWIKRGITCRIQRGLKCRNRAGHGFRLTNRSYRIW
jgi:hypothetical protein